VKRFHTFLRSYVGCVEHKYFAWQHSRQNWTHVALDARRRHEATVSTIHRTRRPRPSAEMTAKFAYLQGVAKGEMGKRCPRAPDRSVAGFALTHQQQLEMCLKPSFHITSSSQMYCFSDRHFIDNKE